jgi:hypothetical protein
MEGEKMAESVVYWGLGIIGAITEKSEPIEVK